MGPQNDTYSLCRTAVQFFITNGLVLIKGMMKPMQDLCNPSMILRMSCDFLGAWAQDQGSSIRNGENDLVRNSLDLPLARKRHQRAAYDRVD